MDTSTNDATPSSEPRLMQEPFVTAPLVLDPKTTAFLLMDFQNGTMARIGDRAASLCARAATVLEAAQRVRASCS